MVTLVVSVIVMFVVVGSLGGWAVREERRRAQAEARTEEGVAK